MSRRIGFIVLTMLAVLLIGIALPVINLLRTRAAVTRCHDNFRTIMLGHASEYPAGTLVNANLHVDRRLSWHYPIAEVVSKSSKKGLLDQSIAWDAGPNADIAKILIARLICPGPLAELKAGPAITNYVGMGGLGVDGPKLPIDSPRAGAFRFDSPTPFEAIRDGLSNTIGFIEHNNNPGPWLAGGRPTVRPFLEETTPAFGVGGQFGGCHPAITIAGFADGSVRNLSISISPSVFSAFATIAGGANQPDSP